MNHAHMKLGRTPTPAHRYATVPHIFDFLEASDATAPVLVGDTCDYRKRMPSPGGMLGNDRYGDCGFAGFGHYKQSVCANLGIPCDVTEKLVLKWYSECTGFDSSRPSTDNGVVLLDALQYFLEKGLILGYGRVNGRDPSHVARALQLFGGLYTGWDLPIAWQNSETWGKGPSLSGEWEPGSWGGHCVSLHAHDAATNCTAVTWGDWKETEEEARPDYCPEVYALILPEWVAQRSIQGFDLASLQTQLALVR